MKKSMETCFDRFAEIYLKENKLFLNERYLNLLKAIYYKMEVDEKPSAGILILAVKLGTMAGASEMELSVLRSLNQKNEVGPDPR